MDRPVFSCVMRRNTVLHFVILTLFIINKSLSTKNNTTNDVNRNTREVLSPQKYLIFPQGSNVQLVYCMTIGTYTKPQGSFTFGVTAGLAYELPYIKTVPLGQSAEVYHRRSRRDLYRKVEVMLRSQGKDGKACVLKALCETGKRKSEDRSTGSFMEEILHAVFTLPSGYYHEDSDAEYEKAHFTTEDCDALFSSCPESMLKKWSLN